MPAKITLSPNLATPGQKITVDGAGFGWRWWCTVTDGSVQVAKVQCSSSGSFTTSFVAGVAGAHTIKAKTYYRSATAVLTVSGVVEPPPPPGPEPPPAIEDWQAAVNAAKPGDTLDFTGTTYRKEFVLSRPGVRVIGGDLDGRGTLGTGVTFRDCADSSIEGMHVHDCTYAGIMCLSLARFKVLGNTIERIAVALYDQAVAAGGPGSWSMNAYGLACSQTSGSICTDGEINDNVVDQVPSWEAYDCHGGNRLAFRRNVAKRANRGFQLFAPSGKSISNITLDDNVVSAPTKRPDVLNKSPYNIVGYYLAGIAGLSGVRNFAEGYAVGQEKATPGSTGDIQVTAR